MGQIIHSGVSVRWLWCYSYIVKKLVLLLLFFSLNSRAEDSLTKASQKLTLKQKISQLFIFGFKGHSIEEDLADKLNHLQPGAVVVFGRNISSLHQVSKLNYEAQKLSLKNTGIPLIIAVDQEGGSVIRIKTSPSLPSALTLGSSGDSSLVKEAGAVTGELLNTLGFNMNLAPVVDISDDNVQGFIANRSFSADPDKVSVMSSAFASGLYSSKVIPVAKHFPGHGKVSSDSHISTPFKKQTLNELFSVDLVPFVNLFKSETPVGVMVAHIAFPLIDTSYQPATFSKPLIEGILRGQLGFKGVVITDDIEMAGSGTADSVGEKAVRAVEAGNDLIMIGWYKKSQLEAINAVYDAVKKGRISEKRIDESLKRIISFKSSVYQAPVDPEPSSLQKRLVKLPFKRVFDQIISNSFASSTSSRAPASLKSKNILVSSASWRFFDTFKKEFSGKSHFMPMNKLKELKDKSSFDAIVVNIFNPSTAALVKSIPQSLRKNVVIVNSGPTKYFQDESEFLSVINVYSTHPDLGKFAAQFVKQISSPTYSMAK